MLRDAVPPSIVERFRQCRASAGGRRKPVPRAVGRPPEHPPPSPPPLAGPGLPPGTTTAPPGRIPRSAEPTLTLGKGSHDYFSDRLTRIGAPAWLRRVAAKTVFADAWRRIAKCQS